MLVHVTRQRISGQSKSIVGLKFILQKRSKRLILFPPKSIADISPSWTHFWTVTFQILMLHTCGNERKKQVGPCQSLCTYNNKKEKRKNKVLFFLFLYKQPVAAFNASQEDRILDCAKVIRGRNHFGQWPERQGPLQGEEYVKRVEGSTCFLKQTHHPSSGAPENR